MKSRFATFFATSLLVAIGMAPIGRAQNADKSNQSQQPKDQNKTDVLFMPQPVANPGSPVTVFQPNNNNTWQLGVTTPSTANANVWQNLGTTLSYIFVTNAGPIQGLNLASADDSLKAHLKLPSDRGLVVTTVEDSSSAYQAGLRANDVLLTLGDTPLAKPEDLEKLLKSTGEKPVTLH